MDELMSRRESEEKGGHASRRRVDHERELLLIHEVKATAASASRS